MTHNEIITKLKAAGIENADGEARMLLEAFSGPSLEAAVSRRCERYPLQYILGEWPFYRETYEVNEHCLIPRQDTEILVDTALHILPNGVRFLDLCTGSGCVAISLLANRPDAEGMGLDLYPETLALAQRNSVRNGVSDRLQLLCHDVLTPPPQALPHGHFDAILSNPPYIKNEVIATLEKELFFEPIAALDGGASGLSFYCAILEKWTALLKPTGMVLFEIGYDQGDDIERLAAAHGFSCTIKKDFGGNDRVAILQKNEI